MLGIHTIMPSASPPKKPAPPQDWHRADIVAAVWKRRSSLIRLSRQNGYADGSLCLALHRPWPKAEKIIADFIGVRPHDIWPSRYHADGTPNRVPGNPNFLKHSTAHKRRAA